MAELVRFSISVEESLLERFENLLRKQGYTNRSEAIRDLVRQELVKHEWTEQENISVVGAISIVYNHHKRDLLNKITNIQHQFHELIISSQHIHLDHDNCFEVILIRGNPPQAQLLANNLKATKGIKHVSINMSSTGRDID